MASANDSSLRRDHRFMRFAAPEQEWSQEARRNRAILVDASMLKALACPIEYVIYDLMGAPHAAATPLLYHVASFGSMLLSNRTHDHASLRVRLLPTADPAKRSKR